MVFSSFRRKEEECGTFPSSSRSHARRRSLSVVSLCARRRHKHRRRVRQSSACVSVAQSVGGGGGRTEGVDFLRFRRGTNHHSLTLLMDVLTCAMRRRRRDPAVVGGSRLRSGKIIDSFLNCLMQRRRIPLLRSRRLLLIARVRTSINRVSEW